MRQSGYYWDAASLQHDTGLHVESIARSESLRPEHIVELAPSVKPRDVKPHDAFGWIEKVHANSYASRVRDVCARGGGILDQGDTVVSRGSFRAAITAVDALLTAADDVIEGSVDSGFSAMRPPGHHARPSDAMGFCLFGNVAILVRYLQEAHGLERIAIVDWDVHHGNGTQEFFWDDPDVLFISLHQSPHWPYSGLESERGAGAGEGLTINIPIAPGTSEHSYLNIFERRVPNKILEFDPDFLIISAGFDAHEQDPLGNLHLTEAGFAAMTQKLRTAADECCAGRIISALEGGYHLEALRRSVASHVRSLME
jgi:acetoin utilization deacetylase AcuC-like enzyme